MAIIGNIPYFQTNPHDTAWIFGQARIETFVDSTAPAALGPSFEDTPWGLSTWPEKMRSPSDVADGCFKHPSGAAMQLRIIRASNSSPVWEQLPRQSMTKKNEDTSRKPNWYTICQVLSFQLRKEYRRRQKQWGRGANLLQNRKSVKSLRYRSILAQIYEGFAFCPWSAILSVQAVAKPYY